MANAVVTYWSESLFVSRTFWFNIAAMLVALASATDIAPIIPSSWSPTILAAASVINIALRMWTVRPVSLTAPGTVTPLSVERLDPSA